MRLAVLKERAAAETRVAATPETVKKLIGLGLTVAVEAGAGQGASISDADYPGRRRRDRGGCRGGARRARRSYSPCRCRRRRCGRRSRAGALLLCIGGRRGRAELVPGLAAGRDRCRPRSSCCRASPARRAWTC